MLQMINSQRRFPIIKMRSFRIIILCKLETIKHTDLIFQLSQCTLIIMYRDLYKYCLSKPKGKSPFVPHPMHPMKQLLEVHAAEDINYYMRDVVLLTGKLINNNTGDFCLYVLYNRIKEVVSIRLTYPFPIPTPQTDEVQQYPIGGSMFWKFLV